jgi:hypothetical protein
MHGRDVCSAVDLSGATKQFGKAITTRTWKTIGRILTPDLMVWLEEQN